MKTYRLIETENAVILRGMTSGTSTIVLERAGSGWWMTIQGLPNSIWVENWQAQNLIEQAKR
jgi:hypothetical protein